MKLASVDGYLEPRLIYDASDGTKDAFDGPHRPPGLLLVVLAILVVLGRPT